MKFELDILDYLGTINIGVLVLISIKYDNKYYESTYYYDTEYFVLTVPDNLDEALGHNISEDEDYTELIRTLIKRVVPFDEIYNRLDPFQMDEPGKEKED